MLKSLKKPRPLAVATSTSSTTRSSGLPIPAQEVAGEWKHAYSREQAVYPLPWLREAKFWPSVKRVDNAAGDRNLVCTCPPMADYVDSPRAAESSTATGAKA